MERRRRAGTVLQCPVEASNDLSFREEVSDRCGQVGRTSVVGPGRVERAFDVRLVIAGTEVDVFMARSQSSCRRESMQSSPRAILGPTSQGGPRGRPRRGALRSFGSVSRFRTRPLRPQVDRIRSPLAASMKPRIDRSRQARAAAAVSSGELGELPQVAAPDDAPGEGPSKASPIRADERPSRRRSAG